MIGRIQLGREDAKRGWTGNNKKQSTRFAQACDIRSYYRLISLSHYRLISLSATCTPAPAAAWLLLC